MMKRINDEQPAPQSVNGDAIWDLVVSDMIERDKSGLEKYGTRLQAGNGRDALVDAYQEALDLSVYLRQAIEERRKDDSRTVIDRQAEEIRGLRERFTALLQRAERIMHWHDAHGGGMIVSAESVRNLWDEIEKSRASLNPTPKEHLNA